MGHDAFQYLHLQYTFFNEAALRGTLPQWLPFMTQGTTSNFWIMVSQGVLASALSTIAPLLKNVNFLYFFEAGLLFDEFILLLGCVLLARRIFKSLAAVLFVSASVTYTAVSSTQPWWDFHLFYLLPLLLYCLDRAVTDASAWHLFLAALLGVGTLLGNLPYFLPVTGFALFAFGAAICISAPRETLTSLKEFSIRLSWRHLFAIVVPLCIAIAIGVYLRDGFAHATFSGIGRKAHGAEVSSAAEFLTYGGYVGLGKFAELVSRYSNNLDNIVYVGLLIVPFSLAALARVRSRLSYAFGITALVLGLFSGGTPVSLAFYYLFPLGEFFRHIGLVAPLAKMFLAFYAGFGFEAFWSLLQRSRYKPWYHGPWKDKFLIFTPIGAMVMISILVAVQRFLGYPIFHFSPWGVSTENQIYVDHRVISSAMTYLTILSCGFLLLLVAIVRWPKWSLVLVSLLLTIHGLDVLWLKTELEYKRVPQIDRAIVSLFTVYDYEFAAHRTQDYYANSRFAALAPTILTGNGLPGRGRQPHATVGRYGGLSASIESFLYLDAIASPFRADFQLDSIDALYHAWWPHPQILAGYLGFPIPEAAAYRKLSGLKFPKLQLFSRIHILQSDEAVAKALTAPEFAGDLVFVTSKDAAQQPNIGPSVGETANLSILRTSDRLTDVSIAVQEFTFDTLRLRLNNPSSQPSVLYYADAWHPNWHAAVNRASAPVLRTNIGYKSVFVPPGNSEVVFWFGDWRSKWLLASIVALGVLIVAGIFSLLPELRSVDSPSVLARGEEGSGQGIRERKSGPPLGRAAGVWRHRSGTLRRSAVVFGTTYFFWSTSASHALGGGVWEVVRLIDPMGLPLIPMGITILASASSVIVAYLLRRVDEFLFVQSVVALGLVLDLLSFMTLGLALLTTRVWLLVHVVALIAVGVLSGSRNRGNKVAYLAGAAVLAYAWFGFPINACYVPGAVMYATYRSAPASVVVVARGVRGSAVYTVPFTCYADLIPRLALEGYKGFNIIAYRGKYFAIPQGEGEFDIERFLTAGYSKSFVGSSVTEVKRSIDASLITSPHSP